jgi:hypothetical protein
MRLMVARLGGMIPVVTSNEQVNGLVAQLFYCIVFRL